MESEAEMHARAEKAVRRLANRLYRKFYTEHREHYGLTRDRFEWLEDGDRQRLFGGVLFRDTGDATTNMTIDVARTVATNAAFRCHHGLVAIQSDHVPTVIALDLAIRWGIGDDDEMLTEFARIAMLMLKFLGSSELGSLRELIDLETARFLARKSFSEDARARLSNVLADRPAPGVDERQRQLLEADGGGEPHWLFLTTCLASVAGDPVPRQRLDQYATDGRIAAIARRHDDFLHEVRLATGPDKQAMWSSVLRNGDQGHLLLLFGSPEVDWIVPVFGSVSVPAAVHQQLQSAWHAMSSLLHVQMPDYHAAVANMHKAVEEELLQTYFEPFFSRYRPSEEAYDERRFGTLYRYGRQWPDKKPTLGEMLYMLELVFQGSGSGTSMQSQPEFVKDWCAYLLVQRCATVRPSLLEALREFRDLRNPSTHAGHPPTERDLAIVSRARAWAILTHVAEERSDSPLVRHRRMARMAERGYVSPGSDD